MSAFIDRADAARSLWLVAESEADGWASRVPASERALISAWGRANAFRGERGRVLLVPRADGELAGAVVGLGRLATLAEITPQHLIPVPDRVPSGSYALAEALPAAAATAAALGWALGRYRFERYRTSPGTSTLPLLVMPENADAGHVRRLTEAEFLARDLINTPAADLSPAELAAAIGGVASRFGAEFRQIIGDQLLAEGFPAIHAVGRAAAVAPRLVELRWGSAGPRVTLVGKGVCFDSGGLDLKPSSAMLLMKKDMGGAACALALAQAVMDARLKLRLRLLVPAVENSVAGNAYRPGDVLATRKGITVEVANTDAEGRLVLADALAFADEEQPDLLVDLATLTGAARVALGPELPALYAGSDALALELAASAAQAADPVWHMPLWAGYEDEFASKVADLANVSASPLAGSIIAALFLRRFVAEATPWLHLDLYAWNSKDRPGRPVGAEAQTVRALYGMLAARYGA
ncbi:MAG TPA: leucyl aminopeptidase family protein [Steroidobacteraceae bacterium]|nr:leucyl aminopeptidase family protein [Steroidobacteraceae bacterium]